MDSDFQSRTISLRRPLDLRLTLAPTRLGKGDPCTKLRGDEAFRASRTPDGPVTLHLRVRGARLGARAWGPGADWALEQLPELVGEFDRGVVRTDHRLILELQERLTGLRIGATRRMLEAMLPAIAAQGTTNFEAKRTYRQVIEKLGDPAPGPRALDLFVPPAARDLAAASFQELHLLGLEQGRADVMRRAAARAAALESATALPAGQVESQIRRVAGVGVWTAAVVRHVVLGDPDVVPVGDRRLADLVAWVFTGNRHGSDAQMLDLLEPFRGQRGRVIRLLRAARLGPS